MGDIPDAMTILSGRESSVRKLDELRRDHGDAPADWMPQLIQAAEEGPSALWQGTKTGTGG
jgi:type IV secretion system protein VirB4